MIAVAFAALALSAPVDEALRDATGRHSAQAAIVCSGELVWSGSANATPNTRYALASTTKPFVAALIVQQIERGRLSLDTKLARFYPRLPNARHITVRMLLTHRSGLEDYLETAAFEAAARDPRHRWTRDEVLSFVRRTVAPGYSNTNYVVLGGILERVTGRLVEQAFRVGIAQRAGLTRSSFRTPPTGGARTDAWGEVWTDGGLVSTAVDLARFGDALFARELHRRPPIGVFGADGWLGHDGSYPPFESQMWHDPEEDLAIAVTTRGGDSEDIFDAVADAFGGC